jgi:hypothetical protein
MAGRVKGLALEGKGREEVVLWPGTSPGSVQTRELPRTEMLTWRLIKSNHKITSSGKGNLIRRTTLGSSGTTSMGWMLLRHLKVTKLLMRMIIKLLLSIIRIGLLARFVAFSIMRLKTVEGCTMKSVD